MKRILASAVAVVAMASSASAFAVTVSDFILTNDQLIDATVTPSPSTPAGVAFSNFYITTDNSPAMITASLSHTVGVGDFLDRFIFAPTFMSVGSGSSVTNSQNVLTFANPGLTVTEYLFSDPAAAGVFGALQSAFLTPDI